MSVRDLAFFVIGLLVFFALALAVQMRLLAGISLKRAARAKFDDLEDGPARFAVVAAVNGQVLDQGDGVGDASAWLAAEYPRAIRHIRIARKATLVFGALLLGVIVTWRLTGEGE